MLTWKALHVLSMVTMITTFIGAEIFYAAAIWRRDAHALAFVQRTVEQTGAGILGLGALFLGVLFGIATAATGGFDYIAPWLLIAYILVVAFLVNSFSIGRAVVQVGKEALEVVAGTRAAEDVTELPANRGVILVGINVIIFATIVADMVLKPSF